MSALEQTSEVKIEDVLMAQPLNPLVKLEWRVWEKKKEVEVKQEAE